VTWWEGETDPERAAIVLHYRGYDLHQRDPADLGTPGSGNAPGESPLTGNGNGQRQLHRTCPSRSRARGIRTRP
jgi:hypothetical protein